jgi:transglutaminase-like putative cysteine protease
VTGTLVRPAPNAAPAARAGGFDPRHPQPPAASPALELGVEVALAGVTAAAALGLGRLFVGASWIGPVLAAVVGGHAVAWACRRLGLGLVASAAISAAGLLLALAWLVEPHTTTLLIPRGATWRAIVDDLSTAWRRFGDVKAPTVPLRGFVLASVAGAWATATTSDFFAFRMRARFEAMAPGFTLFVFGSILGANAWRLPSTALYLAAVLAFVLCSEAARRSATGAWFGGRTRAGDLALLRHGAALGLTAIVVALIVGPHLPGSGSGGLVSWRDTNSGGSRSRVTVSPLVDIRGRLVDQSNLELFTVQSDTPHYWRLTSLDRFDGTIWSSLGTYQPTRGPLPGAATAPQVTQSYEIGPLGTIWLPAAYRADDVTGVKGARFDRDSGSLLAESPTADNLRYRVVSAVPELTQAELAAASPEIPKDVADRYLTLPSDLPPDIVQKAREVTAGAATTYDKARALQDFFRSNFSYSVNVPAGHDDDAMQRFLFVTKTGYCEQFAGTYAAMARAVGIPARVAVGFVPGALNGDGLYHVRGQDAHAWPEVYIGQYGWVAFEPTPGAGRTAPGTEAYTGVRPPSADEAGTTASTAPTTTADTGPTTTANPRQDPANPTISGAHHTGRSRGTTAVLVIAALGALYVGGVPLGRRGLVRRRRAAARTASDRVLVSWQEVEEALALAGHPRRRSETPAEFAARSAPEVGAAGTQLARLAVDTAAAGFAPSGVPADAVPQAELAAEAVAGELRARASAMRRLRWALDPRPLVGAVPRRD